MMPYYNAADRRARAGMHGKLNGSAKRAESAALDG